MKNNIIYDFLFELKSLLAIKEAIANGLKPEEDLNLYLKANRLVDEKMLDLISLFEEELKNGN